jgi:peptidoglycan/xylan/chitin deacetylase (PgdA/CDA1 family)
MLTVCNFHYIRRDFNKPYPSIFGVTPNEFDHQIKELKKMGRFITIDELTSDIDAVLADKHHHLLVTFDDGLKEQFELALPILEQHRTEALFFINSMNFIDNKVSMVHKIHLVRSEVSPNEILKEINKMPNSQQNDLTSSEFSKALAHYRYDDQPTACLKYLLNFKLPKSSLEIVINSLFQRNFEEESVADTLYMSNDQLCYLAERNMLGNHTHSHLALGLLPKPQIEEEILKTKSFIQSFKKNDNLAISYPYGSAEACQWPVPEMAKQTGHKIGFSMERGSNDVTADKLLLKRYSSNDLPGGKNYSS